MENWYDLPSFCNVSSYPTRLLAKFKGPCDVSRGGCVDRRCLREPPAASAGVHCRSARAGAPVVRKPRDHGVVERPLAQRGLRDVHAGGNFLNFHFEWGFLSIFHSSFRGLSQYGGFFFTVQNLAADSIFPEWRMWEQFGGDILITALSLDSLKSSHPIQVF
jgi:hypothetical protein